MTMYELVDTTFSGDLVAACQRGVRVRVILDQNNEKSYNTPAYNQLNAQTNCSAAWANPQFQVTHEKSFIVDGTQVAILTLNLTSVYYGYSYNATRDFALVENDPSDIAAIQATFNIDYGSTTDDNYQPAAADDLIWSPTTAQADLLGIINNAQHTLLVENEEMSASNIVSALEAACRRGVVVDIVMTNLSSYQSNYAALLAAGCGMHTYADNVNTLYIHAKAMLADYGTSAVTAYVGSINFSTASMTENRELGLYVSDPGIQQTLYTTISSDYAGAPVY
jgi:phosphatidylserine/phosphatidylglycerophosphate/cardiolipin synthase-like enzyme